MSSPVVTLDLVIEGLDDAGAGFARHDDLDVHVAGALPGERISAELAHTSPHRRAGRRDAWARVLSVLAPAPARVAPICPAFGRCGGCVLQHLALDQQLVWKRAQVIEALAGVPGLPAVAPCQPSPRSEGYRNQAKYVVGGTAGRIVLGAYAPRSHAIVDLVACRLVEPVLDQVARALVPILNAAGVVPFAERTRTGSLRYVVLRSNAAGEVLVTLVSAREPWPEGSAIAHALRAAIPAVTGVVVNFNPSAGNVIFGAHEAALSGAALLHERLGPVEVALGARAFLQLNRSVAASAYAAIRAAVAAGAGPSPIIYDVYAGVGAVAFALADLGAKVVAIEENPAATAAGAAAAARAGLDHVTFVTARAADALASVDRADVVILNPPRAGAEPAVLKAIARLAPRLVAYLSCNPLTLARDLASLLDACAVDERALHMSSVQPFDMLPHTSHVETLAILCA